MNKVICNFAIILLLPALSMAQGSIFKYGNSVRIEESDSLLKNTFAAGQFVDVSGYLDDDLFAGAENVTINGNVNDDAIVGGRNIRVRGKIGDMLLTAGETIIIDGEIFGDLFAAGNDIHLSPRAVIHGNVALGGNTITIDGASIGGWLRVSGETVNLNGPVGQYVELYGNNFEFGDRYSAGEETRITTYRQRSASDIPNAPDNLSIFVEQEEGWQAALVFGIWFYAAMLILGIVLILLFRETTVDLFRFSAEHYFKNTGIGLLLFLGIPVAAVALLILILTIPLSLIILMLYGLALVISYLLVSLILGTKSLRFFKLEDSFADYYWGLAVGMIVILILTTVPYIGGVINLLLIFFGLGTLLSYLWQVRANAI